MVLTLTDAHLVDFGQNFAGRVALTVRDLPAGARVTLRHGEALDEHGYPRLAHALLSRTELPSWRYPLRHGATTIWERWDGYTEERGFQAAAMNSFNHYALGSVGEWLYRGVAGIDQEPDSVGYQRLRIRPRLGGPELAWVRASYESVRGTVAVRWERSGDQLRLAVSIPPGATATVHVPTTDPASVRESGRPVDGHPDVWPLGSGPGVLRCGIGSGDYEFTASADPVAGADAVASAGPAAGMTT